LYYEAARKGRDIFAADYLEVFVYSAADHDAYLARIDGEATRARLATWRDGCNAWQRLYTDEGAP
jgi:hypothetical protein